MRRSARYHWNRNAKTHFLIGEGIGKAMVELLGGPKTPQSDGAFGEQRTGGGIP